MSNGADITTISVEDLEKLCGDEYENLTASPKSEDESLELEKLSVSYKTRYQCSKYPKPKETDCDDYDVCETCSIRMEKQYDEYTLICPKCQIISQIGNDGEYTIGAGENNNTSSNAYMSFKSSGKGTGLYRNALIKYTSNIDNYKSMRLYRHINRFNFSNKDFKLPADVLQDARDLIISLGRNDATKSLKRGKCARGLIGAVLFAECQRRGIAKTFSQIAAFMKIDVSEITSNYKELHAYSAQGLIDIPVNCDTTEHFIIAYFEEFKISDKYKPFVLHLINRMKEKKVGDIDTWQITTQCIGVIYLLSAQVNLGITHECIANHGIDISKGTYMKVYNAILENETKLRKSFHRFNIPFPIKWKPINKK